MIHTYERVHAAFSGPVAAVHQRAVNTTYLRLFAPFITLIPLLILLSFPLAPLLLVRIDAPCACKGLCPLSLRLFPFLKSRVTPCKWDHSLTKLSKFDGLTRRRIMHPIFLYSYFQNYKFAIKLNQQPYELLKYSICIVLMVDLRDCFSTN